MSNCKQSILIPHQCLSALGVTVTEVEGEVDGTVEFIWQGCIFLQTVLSSSNHSYYECFSPIYSSGHFVLSLSLHHLLVEGIRVVFEPGNNIAER